MLLDHNWGQIYQKYVLLLITLTTNDVYTAKTVLFNAYGPLLYCLNYVVVNFIVSNQLTHIVSNQLTPQKGLGDLFNIAVTSEQEVAILSLPVPSPKPGGI